MEREPSVDLLFRKLKVYEIVLEKVKRLKGSNENLLGDLDIVLFVLFIV